MEHKFKLGDEVVFSHSARERGMVIGIATYLSSMDMALLRYHAADYRVVERWWPVDVLERIS